MINATQAKNLAYAYKEAGGITNLYDLYSAIHMFSRHGQLAIAIGVNPERAKGITNALLLDGFDVSDITKTLDDSCIIPKCSLLYIDWSKGNGPEESEELD